MVPKVPKTGRSFLGAWNYYAHDKRTQEQADQNEAVMSSERVAWSHTENMAGLDADRVAVHLMKMTAAQNTRCKQPVYAFSLAWHPEQQPDKDEMIEAGRQALKTLGMEEHQALFIAHRDREHPHVHIIVNRVHPQTLKAQNNYRDFKRLSEWAQGYEQAQGKIYCQAREARQTGAGQGPANERYADNTLLAAWGQSDNGRSFQAALAEKGWMLGLGDRKDRFMVLAPNGKPLDILRELNKTLPKGEKLRQGDIERRFADLDRSSLKRIAALQAEAAKRREEERQIKAFKEHDFAEALKTIKPDRSAERRAIQQQHRDLQRRHQDQQRIHQRLAHREREAAAQAIIDTYRIEETQREIRDLQKSLTEKGGFFDRITGRHAKRQAQIKEDLAALKLGLADAKIKAAHYDKMIETRIRADADALALRQKRERDALPALETLNERAFAPAREQDNERDAGRERSRDQSRRFHP